MNDVLCITKTCVMKPLKLQKPCRGSDQMFLPEMFMLVDKMKFRAIRRSLIPRPISDVSVQNQPQERKLYRAY